MLHSYQIKFMLNEKNMLIEHYYLIILKNFFIIKDLIFKLEIKFLIRIFSKFSYFCLIFIKLVTPLSVIPQGIIELYFSNHF